MSLCVGWWGREREMNTVVKHCCAQNTFRYSSSGKKHPTGLRAFIPKTGDPWTHTGKEGAPALRCDRCFILPLLKILSALSHPPTLSQQLLTVFVQCRWGWGSYIILATQHCDVSSMTHNDTLADQENREHDYHPEWLLATPVWRSYSALCNLLRVFLSAEWVQDVCVCVCNVPMSRSSGWAMSSVHVPAISK